MADPELIGCWDAIQAIKRDGESDSKAFSRIMRRCMSSQVRCVAQTWRHDKSDVEQNVEVPAATWDWDPLTIAGLDLHTGDWTLISGHRKRSLPSGAGVWAYLTGIRFDRAGIADIMDKNEPKSLAVETQAYASNAGRSRSDKWLDWVAVAIRLASDSKIDETMTESKVMKAVDERLAFLGLPTLGETSVRPQAVRILEMLRKSEDEFYTKGE